MKPTDVIKYLHHYKGCPFRYEYSYVHEGVEYTEVVLSKVDTLIFDDEMTVFEGTCNGEPIEEYFIFFNRFDKFRLILTHPLRLLPEQLGTIKSLKNNYALQLMFCFEQFIDIFGFIDAGIAINAFPNRRKSSHAINTPAILLNEQWKAKRKQYYLNAKNKSK